MLHSYNIAFIKHRKECSFLSSSVDYSIYHKPCVNGILFKKDGANEESKQCRAVPSFVQCKSVLDSNLIE